MVGQLPSGSENSKKSIAVQLPTCQACYSCWLGALIADHCKNNLKLLVPEVLHMKTLKRTSKALRMPRVESNFLNVFSLQVKVV